MNFPGFVWRVRCLFIVAMILAHGSIGRAADAVPSFVNEIAPILTKNGCNQGACHGKGAGQNGFRLSLRGYAPDEDHRWLTREFDARRIDPADPASSLLLRKAVAQVPHEGGRLFSSASREYATLFAWIKAGAPGVTATDAKLTKLELLPSSEILKVGQTVPLVAWGTFSDGSRRDVTWLTKFDSNDVAAVTVTPTGLATAARNGATAVRASFLSEVAVANFLIPYDRTVDASKFTGGMNFIDVSVLSRLKELRIEPSAVCTDAEFIRRVFLDSCGILPTPDEVTKFLADTTPSKRAKLIDSLLSRPEFTDYWALQLGDVFQNRKERDHDVRGVKGVREFHEWIRKQVAANRGWDAIAYDVLTATGTTQDAPAVGYFIVTVGENRHAEKSEVGESVAQAFLGTRIGCAKCHNHPLERYTQDDFYHFAAFFSRVNFSRKDQKQGLTTLKIGHPDANENKRPVGTRQPRTGAFLAPQTLDRETTKISPTDDPRVSLAKWMIDPKNEFFAGAMVNRIWRHFMGVGLVEPVDDLRGTNPPTNPKLWADLKAEFVNHKYDLRHLMRQILNSRTYQTSSATLATNQDDSRFYSHYAARRLPAEVLLDAISDSTGRSETFDGYPEGVRAVQVPDPGTQSYFLKLFGRSDRVTACACERTGDVTMPQLLHLQNGDRLLAKIHDDNGWLAKELKAQPNNDRVCNDLFFRTLSRPARPEELELIRGHLAKGSPREELFRDLFWAIINSKDFAFNH